MIVPQIVPPNFPSPTPRAVPSTSRYALCNVTQARLADGRQVSWLSRRFLPQPDVFTTIAVHTVVQGDRLDNVTAKYMSDPTLFYRVCDANLAMHPDELCATLGRQLEITLPEGMPGGQSA